MHAGVVVAFAATQLPCPQVNVRIRGAPERPVLEVGAKHTLKPSFEAASAQLAYKQLPSTSMLTVELSDRKRRHRAVLLGTATFSASRVQVS